MGCIWHKLCGPPLPQSAVCFVPGLAQLLILHQLCVQGQLAHLIFQMLHGTLVASEHIKRLLKLVQRIGVYLGRIGQIQGPREMSINFGQKLEQQQQQHTLQLTRYSCEMFQALDEILDIAPLFGRYQDRSNL